MEYAECRLCMNGVLLPFTGPEGRVVYFCTNCRARFSGYHEEPMFEGAPVFSEMAYYSFRNPMEKGESLTEGELLDSYHSILEELPPEPLDEAPEGCDYCSGDVLFQWGQPDICWLPTV